MRKLYRDFHGGRAALGLLILRVVAGVAMVIHGWPKIQNPLHWMDKMGSGTPAVLQALAALGEFAGGLGLIVGLLTPIACFGIAATMVGAILIGTPGALWIGKPGEKSFELASLYLLIAVAVFFIGPGLYSLDAKLFGKRRL